MKLVIQRVSQAEVRVDDAIVGSIKLGLLVLVGLEHGDSVEQVDRAARRVATLRVFEDEHKKMNRGLDEVAGAVLAVSQFTLAASIRRGRRPSFDNAMEPQQACRLFDEFVARLRQHDIRVETGVFGAEMNVELVNAGPVTLLWEDAGRTDSCKV